MDIDAVIAAFYFKHKPFPHQLIALKRSVPKRRFALFMDQGTGKTKVIIDTCAILYKRGVLEALLVIAPIDVHTQWVVEQFPEHWPSHALRAPQLAAWSSSSARARRACDDLITKPVPRRFRVLSMNHESFSTAAGVKLAQRFLKKYPKNLVAIDESDLAIKTPNASRTKAIVHRIAPLSFMRRILTGTPASNPFELYSPFKFLDERILGFDSMLAFKHRYALWEENFTHIKTKNGDDKLHTYETLLEYQNLDELNARTAPFIYSVRKEDCLNLPPKLYSFRQTHLSKAQRAIYNEMRENGLALIRARAAQEASGNPRNRIEPLQLDSIAELSEEELLERMQTPGLRSTAALKIVLYLRLQQIVGGFFTDDDKRVHTIEGKVENTPRIDATLQLIDNALKGSAKIIVWAVYRAELEALKDCIGRILKVPCGLVYGGVKGKTREDIIANFKTKTHPQRILVSHPNSLGVGMNFTVAQTMAYYSCGASGRVRLQSEDRAHRIGQTGTVNIYDLDCSEVPIDARLRELRAEKIDFNKKVMGWSVEELERNV